MGSNAVGAACIECGGEILDAYMYYQTPLAGLGVNVNGRLGSLFI